MVFNLFVALLFSEENGLRAEEGEGLKSCADYFDGDLG